MVPNDTRVIAVGIAELSIASHPVNLSVVGLGSCIGLCLYDPDTRTGGIAHVMLPDSSRIRNNANRAKFADTAVEALIEEMSGAGVNPRRIVAKIAGGACMFQLPGDRNLLKLGERNTDSVKLALKKNRILLVAEDVGGHYSRTIMLDTATGSVLVKTINCGEKVI
jgi:chemotaxis protein CheD